MITKRIGPTFSRCKNQVARDIAEGVRARLTPRERTLLTHAPPVSPEAYEYYLRGLFFHNLHTGGLEAGDRDLSEGDQPQSFLRARPRRSRGELLRPGLFRGGAVARGYPQGRGRSTRGAAG